MGKTSEELAEERRNRIDAAINLKEADRVPLTLGFDFGFIANWSGITTYELLFDYDKARKAIVKVATDFPTDMPPATMMGTGPLLFFALRNHLDVAGFGSLTGPMHIILRDKYTRWPGVELSPYAGSYQYIGGEFLKPEEYDMFIEDPFKFMAEVAVPRAHFSLEKPGSPEAMAALIKAGAEVARHAYHMGILVNELAKLGYSFRPSVLTLVPLDFLGDYLRTITGILLDLRKVPEKVKLACNVLLHRFMLKTIFNSRSLQSVSIPLHLNEYLSPKLYSEFYWPHLKKIIFEACERGIKCHVAFEGRHDAHLERLLELPRGWGVAMFEKTDIRKAKRLLKGHTCVTGGIPPTLLLKFTPKQIEEYVKKLLEDTMHGGGLILATSTAIPAAAPPENVKAVIKAVEKYGVFRR